MLQVSQRRRSSPARPGIERITIQGFGSRDYGLGFRV